jgi:hypothetical protein
VRFNHRSFGYRWPQTSGPIAPQARREKKLLPVKQKPQGHFLYFLCFASVKNCETYPPAREKNKQVPKNKIASASFMDIKHTKL